MSKESECKRIIYMFYLNTKYHHYTIIYHSIVLEHTSYK